MDISRQELMIKYMRPSRLERWIEMGDDLDGFMIASNFDIIKCNTVKFVVLVFVRTQEEMMMEI